MNLRDTKLEGISKLAEDMLASQEGMCSIELVTYGKDVSVNTPVSESEATCLMQVDQACFKKIRSEILSKYCRIYL
jgi:hypothetical protein